jgi:hypothetical protein
MTVEINNPSRWEIFKLGLANEPLDIVMALVWVILLLGSGWAFFTGQPESTFDWWFGPTAILFIMGIGRVIYLIDDEVGEIDRYDR